MGRGQQRSMNICVEVQAKGKAHMNMESEIRSMARQRRVVCVALLTALITFTAYVVYINSGIPSEENTTFFEGQLAPASLLEDPLTVCLLLPNFLLVSTFIRFKFRSTHYRSFCACISNQMASLILTGGRPLLYQQQWHPNRR